MKRIVTLYLAVFMLVMFNGVVLADSFEQYYKDIRPVQPTQSGDKIEVLEVFWYGCPHCYHFEPYLQQWLKTKPEYVAFRRMPGIFSKNWIPHAKAYFTAMKLGVLEKIHDPLFDALHKQKRRLFSENTLKKFFMERGIDGDDFTRIYNSNDIETKVRQAFVMGQRYGVTGVPSIIVNGKYRTSASLTGSFENMLKVVDQLVDKEKGGLKQE
ncbi:MAG: thiol:disulfide interchange protein DsbA/DsbL [Gammaproteobacteria bacterium]